MFEMILFLIALIGSSIAALYDLKTTEIPDKVPYTMIFLALVFILLESLLQKSFLPLFISLVSGLTLLVAGSLMYYLGQWGGADTILLAALGFFSPGLSLLATNIQYPFALSYFLNVLFIGYTVYTLGYVLILSIFDKRIFHKFFITIKSNMKFMLLSSAILFLLFIFLNWLIFYFFDLVINLQFLILNSFIILLMFALLFLLWKFLKVANEVAFKKKISTSKLKVGDMLAENRLYEGITEKEIKKIKRSGKKYVWIKEGIRFAPVFPLALLFTCYIGDAILLYIRLFI